MRKRNELDGRLVGLSQAELNEIPQRIAVAGGPDKAPGVIGAIRAGWIDTLVTDLPCAGRMREILDAQS